MGNGKKNNFFCVLATSPCVQSIIQASRLKDYFQANNWVFVANFKQADLILIDTCAFTQDFENTAIKKITQIQSQKKAGAKVVVSGCLVNINKQRLASVFQGDCISGDKIDEIAKLCNFTDPVSAVRGNLLFRDIYSQHTFIRKIMREITDLISSLRGRHSRKAKEHLQHLFWYGYGRNSFYIKIGSGCMGNCSYCAIPLAKGQLNSKPLEQVIGEFKDGLAKGYHDFVLLGDDISSYGRERGDNIILALKELLAVEGDYKIAISYLHPKHLIAMFASFKEIFKSGKIAFLLCPAQSGNNRILKLMNRGYTAEEYIKCIKELQKDVPGLIIRNQLLVGFPTENKEEFNQTLRLIKETNCSEGTPFIYSDRPGTIASMIDGKISENEKKKRFRKAVTAIILNKLRYNFKYICNLHKR